MTPATATLPAPPEPAYLIRDPGVSVYRRHTIALLRHYFCLSVEVGRLPRLLGRECFRSRARSYRLSSFEDTVIFVIDVERFLARLDPFDQKLIACVVLQEFTQDEAARLLHLHRNSVSSRLADALDCLTEMFLGHRMLVVTRSRQRAAPPKLDESVEKLSTESCDGGEPYPTSAPSVPIEVLIVTPSGAAILEAS